MVVRGSGEYLRLLGGDGGVAGDHLGENAAKGFNAQRQGRHVQQQDILNIASKNATLPAMNGTVNRSVKKSVKRTVDRTWRRLRGRYCGGLKLASLQIERP